MISPDESAHRIGIALSGGGVRAAAFHAGAFRWFAEKRSLENIAHISSVSGGSLFAGLVFHFSNYRWPTSEEYNSEVLNQVRSLLTSKSLQANALLRLIFNPLNWRFLLTRANVFSKSIEHYWCISAKLEQLPARPVWSINGTTAENGRRFRFKGTEMGDYEIGYTDDRIYKLASAMAVSAAFPGGIGPLRLDASQYKWFKRKGWDLKELAEITPPFKTLNLYDGGVYDNLGLEPLFDVGSQTIKRNDGSPLIDFIVVSDAGAPYRRCAIPGPLNPKRLKRVADVAFDQARALRVRVFTNFLKNNSTHGMYLQIGSNPLDKIEKYAREADVPAIKKDYNWLSSSMINDATRYKTTLKRMSESDFNLIEEHGYQTARWNGLVFYSGRL